MRKKIVLNEQRCTLEGENIQFCTTSKLKNMQGWTHRRDYGAWTYAHLCGLNGEHRKAFDKLPKGWLSEFDKVNQENTMKSGVAPIVSPNIYPVRLT